MNNICKLHNTQKNSVTQFIRFEKKVKQKSSYYF